MITMFPLSSFFPNFGQKFVLHIDRKKLVKTYKGFLSKLQIGDQQHATVLKRKLTIVFVNTQLGLNLRFTPTVCTDIPLFGILGGVNFVCLNAQPDENASYATCSLIRQAVQMAFFDRDLINPSNP